MGGSVAQTADSPVRGTLISDTGFTTPLTWSAPAPQRRARNARLNGHDEPIVNPGRDALGAFHRLGLDFLVIEDALITPG
jgi:hypothetical protein